LENADASGDGMVDVVDAMTRVVTIHSVILAGFQIVRNRVTGVQRRNRPLADSARGRLADLH
jgi:hypothetical protein